MDSLRVDITYRPVRIGWAMLSTDLAAFRQAVRYSYALWGGRYNPILFVDRPDEARELIESFHVDVVWPIGSDDAVQKFPDLYPHLTKPGYNFALFSEGRVQFLDVLNMLTFLREKEPLKSFKAKGVRDYKWEAADPLADIFLATFGGYPEKAETKYDLPEIFAREAAATEYQLPSGQPLPGDVGDFPSLGVLCRIGLDPDFGHHHPADGGGFFIGSAASLDDLACFWNMRATHLPLWFVDENHLARYAALIPGWAKAIARPLLGPAGGPAQVGIWSRQELTAPVKAAFVGVEFVFSKMSAAMWAHGNEHIPVMHLGKTSVLAMKSAENGAQPRLAFSLSEKPYADEPWASFQHLVASLSFLGGLYDDDDHTLKPPFVPELNEFYGRTMHLEPDSVRVEPEGVGLIIKAFERDTWIRALPVSKLFERVFQMAGYSARLGPGGLIVRQLLTSLGGLHGATIFQNPGVRRLLKAHGASASISKRDAIHLIASPDPTDSGVKAKEKRNRRTGEQAPDPGALFGHLVEKGLFRIGIDLTCPHCRLGSWVPVDSLKQKVTCERCGRDHDATRQIAESEWSFRRSGVLGAEKNAQGSVPVALTLQRLKTTLHGFGDENAYSPSLELEPFAPDRHKCELDFVWMSREPRWKSSKTIIVLSECKDQMPIDIVDIEHLREVADALPAHRFEVFILLTKLRPFTPEEIAYAKTLNDGGRCRVLLLTARELEPYSIFERTKEECVFTEHGHSLGELARVFETIYFRDPSVPAIEPKEFGRQRLLRVLRKRQRRLQLAVGTD